MITTRDSDALPAASAAALRHLTEMELSRRSRLGFVALLLFALAMTGVVATLWATEPGLPLRTHMAFGLLAAIGSGWVVFALWVLTRRRVLLAGHRVVAGRMAVTCTAAFTLAALALGYATGRPEAYKAAGVGLLMFGAALGVLAHARRAFARLTERRALLEHQLEAGER